jgi:pullulanase/glycogen debranching enzyme
VLANPPVLWDIESDPALAGTKLIAEAWDAAGLYEVGSFIGDNWKEWNGQFRDDVRSFFAEKMVLSDALPAACWVARQSKVMKNVRLSKALPSLWKSPGNGGSIT